MSLETYTGKIADLVITNPQGTDPKSQGDDHLRGIKKTIFDDAVRVSGSPLQQLGDFATDGENHFWDGSVANQLTLKRGVPGAPGATVMSVVGGNVAFPNTPSFSFRNVLINGSLAINQRGVTIAAAANGAYGPDRWKKVDASNMTQIVEGGNFIPNTEYTLSGTNVTTQQITSPASGNWTIPNIPITATNVQLEKGSIATPFERRPYGLELELCQRYYERFVTGLAGYVNAASGQIAPIATFKTEKRANPTITLLGNSVLVNVSSVTFDNISTLGARLVITATAAGTASLMSLYSASAEL